MFFNEIGAEIWEGDECRKFQFLESGHSLKGQKLLIELPFLWNSLPTPSFIECLDPIQWKGASLHWFLLRRIPIPEQEKLSSVIIFVHVTRTFKVRWDTCRTTLLRNFLNSKSKRPRKSPCHKRGEAKEDKQKVTKSVKKVTKRLPKGDRKRKKWPTPFCIPSFAAQWEMLKPCSTV